MQWTLQSKHNLFSRINSALYSFEQENPKRSRPYSAKPSPILLPNNISGSAIFPINLPSIEYFKAPPHHQTNTRIGQALI